MVFELNLTNLLGMASVFVSAMWVLVKVIAVQQEKHMDAKFKALDVSIKEMRDAQDKERETTTRLERELLRFQAELPRDYVRRDDFVRVIGTIETKIDNMALRVERAVLANYKGEV